MFCVDTVGMCDMMELQNRGATNMNLYHTSPNAEITPTRFGTFDEFIFFSNDVYVMTAGDYHVFTTEIDESLVIGAPALWYQENWEDARQYIDELMRTLNIDEDTAMGLLDESIDITDLDIDACELGTEWWNVQRLTARCAKALGYIGVRVEDEQGSAYMLDVEAICITTPN